MGCGPSKHGVWSIQTWGMVQPNMGCGPAKHGVWSSQTWGVVQPNMGDVHDSLIHHPSSQGWTSSTCPMLLGFCLNGLGFTFASICYDTNIYMYMYMCFEKDLSKVPIVLIMACLSTIMYCTLPSGFNCDKKFVLHVVAINVSPQYNCL